MVNYYNSNYTLTQYQVEVETFERAFRAELRILFNTLSQSGNKVLAKSLCDSYTSSLKEDFERLVNDKRNVRFVHNELEKPKGAAMEAIYRDISPFKQDVIDTFNKYDKTMPYLEDVESSSTLNPWTLLNDDSSDVEDEISTLSQDTSSSSSIHSTEESTVKIPLSKKGHFDGARAYIHQDPIGETLDLSLGEAHSILGREAQDLFTKFADSGLVCPTCNQKDLELLRQRIKDIAEAGNLFLAGGVSSDGRLVLGRVELMKMTLEGIKKQMIEWAESGDHGITRSARISIAVNC